MDKIYELASTNIRPDPSWNKNYWPIYRILVTRDQTRRVICLRAHDGTWDSFYVNRWGDITEYLGYCHRFDVQPLLQVIRWLNDNA